MSKETAIKTASDYFKNHKVDEFYVTSDQQVFFSERAALNHSGSLMSKDVTKVTRAEAEGISEGDAKADKVAKLKAAVSKQEAAIKEADEKYDAEKDEKKKNKIASTRASLVKKLEELSAELAALQSE